MADTENNIEVSNGEWVDLYAASGITFGTKLKIQNIGYTAILLHTGSTAPTDDTAFNVISPSNDFFVNQLPSTGEWAKSVSAKGYVNVGEAE